MRNTVKLHFLVLVIAIAFAGLPGISEAQRAGQYKKVLVRFPAFSLEAGEKIVGVNVTVYNGEIVHVFMPRGWTLRYSGTPVTQHIMHCFSPNSVYAITMTARLPELSIYDMSSISNKSLSIEASVEIEDGSGKTHSKQIEESALILL